MGKKKGRPSLLDIQKRKLRLQQQQQQKEIQNQALKSHNPNLDDEDDDDERSNGRRKEKKLKLVHQIPSSTNFLGSDDGDREKTGQWNNSSKGTDGHQELGPPTPLPDKNLLEFILDRLQKKDTYGVFLEPVDPNELPDYHDMIKNPMDFGTVRKKLSNGAYANLEQFEKDVFLICSNAMQYNSSDTIYHRQARAIEEVAKKNFENLRQEESDDSESEAKAEPKTVARRGRPPSSNKKHEEAIAKPLTDRVTDISSNTTLANAKDGTFNSYNLRQIAPISWVARQKLESIKESSGYGMKANSWKYGKGVVAVDENRRNTYMHVCEASVLSAFDGDEKQLVPVRTVYGQHPIEHTYATSLARFGANLGPIGWAITAKKIERVLPAGTKFGRGWVGESEAPRLNISPYNVMRPSWQMERDSGAPDLNIGFG